MSQLHADSRCCVARFDEEFYAVGQFYRVFGQTSDEEVRELLDKARSTGADD